MKSTPEITAPTKNDAHLSLAPLMLLLTTMKMGAFVTLCLLAAASSYGQGTFLFDQQSSSNEGYYGYGVGPTLDSLLPSTGQSFTPSISAIDFIRLNLNDGNPGDGLGSTWFLNLRANSIAGPILGTTSLVGLPDGFTGAVNFFFANTIPVRAGTTYFFDVNSPDGGAWHMLFSGYNYSGGDGWVQGHDNPGGDYWFREGILVPEPSSASLLLLGGAALGYLRRAKAS